MAVFLDKTVIRRIPVCFVFCESLDENAGISLAKCSEGSRSIHAFGTNSEPFCQFIQEVTSFFVDTAVRKLENIEKHGSVFGDDVHQHLDDMARPLKRLFGIIKPVSDAGIGLPWIVCDPGKLTFLNIQNTDAVNFFASVFLGINGFIFSVSCDRIVIKIRYGIQSGLIAIVAEGKAAVRIQIDETRDWR